MIFHDFFGIDFRIDFFIDFWCKMAPKMVHFILMRRAFWLPFRDLFRRPIFWCILVAPWLTFGSLLVPVGSLLAPVGSLLAPAGSLLAPFGSLWLPFGSLLVSLGSLLVPFPSLLLTQGSIFSLLLYPVVIFRIFWINLSCQRQKFRSGPLKGGLEEKVYFLLGCVRFASGKYDFIDR